MTYATIDGFESMTAQEVFDAVAKHLLTQRKASASDDGTCMYRGLGGLKCAAGIFLRNDIAKEYEVDSDNPDAGTWEVLANRDVVPRTNAVLIDALQRLHDFEFEPNEWEKGLAITAETFGLNFNPNITHQRS